MKLYCEKLNRKTNWHIASLRGLEVYECTCSGRRCIEDKQLIDLNPDAREPGIKMARALANVVISVVGHEGVK